MAAGALATLGALLAVLPYGIEHLAELRRQVQEARERTDQLTHRVATLMRELEATSRLVREASDHASEAARSAQDLPLRVHASVEEVRARLERREDETAEKLSMVGDLLTRAIARVAEVERGFAEHLPAAAETADKLARAAASIDEMTIERLRADNQALRAAAGAARDAGAARLEAVVARLEAALAEQVASAVESSKADVASGPGVAAEGVREAGPGGATAGYAAEPEVAGTRAGSRRRLPISRALETSLIAPSTPAVDRLLGTPPADPAARSGPPPKPSHAPVVRPRAAGLPVAREPGVPGGGESAGGVGKERAAGVGDGPDDGGPGLGLEIPAPAAGVFAPVPGAPTLYVKGIVGIGNRLFVRGDGPGLTREKGAPMHEVRSDLWAWSSPDAAAPVRVVVLRNDEEPANAGEVELVPGEVREIGAVF